MKNLNDLIKKHSWIGEIEIDKLSSVRWDNIEEQKDKYTYSNAEYFVDEFLKKLKKYKQCEFDNLNRKDEKETYKATYENDIVVLNKITGNTLGINKNEKDSILLFLRIYSGCYRGYTLKHEIKYPTVTREEFYKIEKFMEEIRWNI
jgi:hypothetical protein